MQGQMDIKNCNNFFFPIRKKFDYMVTKMSLTAYWVSLYKRQTEWKT